MKDHRSGVPASGANLDVRRIRQAMGLTQHQFAEKLEVSAITVHRWETGQSHPHRLALTQLHELEKSFAGQSAPQEPDQEAPAAPPSLDFNGNPNAVLAVAEALRLKHGYQFNPTFATETSRIDPLPHQRIAVYERMLEQDPLRFLLADDAGAGKTIMTGLVVREMLYRHRIRRVLIIPPAGLVGNWERELRTLFRLQFRIVSGEDIRAGNPFLGPEGDFVIISLDTLAGESAFRKLAEREVPPYDLIVFDEAHKLSVSGDNNRVRKTRRYELAEALTNRVSREHRFAGLGWVVRHLLLLTATPHMGKDLPYYYLWRLLDPEMFGTAEAVRRFPQEERSRHFIRRTKEEMVDLNGRPLYPQRHCDTFSYDLSSGDEGEQALYDRTTSYLRDVYSRSLSFNNRPAVQLAMTVFQRRLASSTSALLCSFKRRIKKIEGTIADLNTGQMNVAELEDRQHKLDAKYYEDFFDAYSADEDAPDDKSSERHEDYENAVLGAVIAVTLDDLKRELAILEDLSGLAHRLLESGRESKFEKLREVLEDQNYAQGKWLVFSEHRDTVDYLVRRLEGLGYCGQVAQIHGGMAWPEREKQVAQFRKPEGAHYLVATDAAGEGINLQFCRLMVNYDIPWNPARLEQRMGRIHRYGQKHSVRIVNLVAGSTREGRVLQVLFDKLDAVRKELSSDKVFDVIGRLFENQSLREYLIDALTDEDEQRTLGRIEKTLAGTRIRDIEKQNEGIYGRSGEIAEYLPALRSGMEIEPYLRLLPAYVRCFVERSADLLGLKIRGNLDGFFSFTPGHPGALDKLLPAFEDYSPDIPEQLSVYKPETDVSCIWLHPGEPVFDALCEQILSRFTQDARRGAIFADPKVEASYLFHIARLSVERQPEGIRTNNSTAEPSSCRKNDLVEQQLLGIKQVDDGAVETCAIEPLMLLSGAPHVAPGAVPLAEQAPNLCARAKEHVDREVLTRLAEKHRNKQRDELSSHQQQVEISYDLRAAELMRRRAKLAKSNADNQSALDDIKQQQKNNTAERSQAIAALASVPDRIVSKESEFLVHALVVPATGSEENERHDARVEAAAVRIAVEWEKERKAQVQDVSSPHLARKAGLTDWPGFDLLSKHPDGEVRSIEVKGRAGRGTIRMEHNEWKQAYNLEDRYWLYVVFDCASPKPLFIRVQNPFMKLLAKSSISSGYIISYKQLSEVSE